MSNEDSQPRQRQAQASDYIGQLVLGLALASLVGIGGAWIDAWSSIQSLTQQLDANTSTANLVHSRTNEILIHYEQDLERLDARLDGLLERWYGCQERMGRAEQQIGWLSNEGGP